MAAKIKYCKRCGVKFKARSKTTLYCCSTCQQKEYNKEAISRQENKTRSNTGAMGELFVCADLIDKGLYVFRSSCVNSPVDIVALGKGELIKIEVKTGRISKKTGSLYYSNPRNDEYDLLAVYCIDTSDITYFDIDGNNLSYF